jgi:DNA-binding protein, histone-like, putative
MKYVVQLRKKPQNREEGKYYLIARSLGVVDLSQICEEISLSSSLTRGDVSNTIMSFLDIIPKYLKMGYSVKLGELGSFRLSIKSEGSDMEKEATASKMKKIHTLFVPSAKIKKEISDTTVELYAS